MKKSIIVSAVFATMLISGAVYANPAQSFDKANDVVKGAEIERVFKSNGDGMMYEIIDHNPTRYSKKQVGNDIVESWVEDGVAYTSVNGDIKKTHQIKENLQMKMKPNGEMYELVNQSLKYQPQRTLQPNAGAK